MSDKKTITLDTLKCTKTGDHQHDGDEPYFFYTVDGGIRSRCPTNDNYGTMEDGDSVSIGLVIEFRDNVRIELYDSDGGVGSSHDDFLGTHTYHFQDNLTTTAVFDDAEGHYEIVSRDTTAAKSAPEPA